MPGFNPVQIPWASYSGAGLLMLSAGGTNQNIVLSPSGAGYLNVTSNAKLTGAVDIGSVGSNNFDAMLNVVSAGKVARLGGGPAQRFIQFTNTAGTAEFFYLGTDANAYPVFNLAGSNTFTITAGAHIPQTSYASGGTYFGDAPTDPGSNAVLVQGNFAAGGSAISLPGLPTSSSGLSAGRLWRNGNAVNIV